MLKGITIEEIMTVSSEEEANQAEIAFISQFRCIELGYNIQPGGAGNNNIKGSKNPKSKLSEEQIIEIKIIAKQNKYTQTELANKFGVHRTTIQRILYNKNWIVENENPIYTRKNKLTSKDVEEIQTLILQKNITQTEIAKIYNITKSMISHIKYGRWNK